MNDSQQPAPEAACLDQPSGLYTLEHFHAVLARELAWLDRWERPLSLVVLEPPADLDRAGGWAAFGRLLRSTLRGIDTAARMDRGRALVLLPDADASRCRRWLASLFDGLRRDSSLAGRPVRFGRALARPWEGRRGEELLAQARAALGDENLDFTAGPGTEDDPADDTRTAIAADERNLLFAGFQALEACQNH